jgi:hypothetical protein
VLIAVYTQGLWLGWFGLLTQAFTPGERIMKGPGSSASRSRRPLLAEK